MGQPEDCMMTLKVFIIMLLSHKLVVLFPLVVLDQEQVSTVW